MGIQQNISRLEVAMNHANVMGIIHGKTDGGEELHNHRRVWNIAQPGSPFHIVSQRLTFNVLHNHIGRGVVCLFRSDVKVMDAHNVRMMQCCDKASFSLKASNKIRVILQTCMKELDGHITMKLNIESFPD